MVDRKPVTPRDLQAAGRAVLQAVSGFLTCERLTLDPHELIVLHEACRVADRLAELRDALAGADLHDPVSVRLLAEERQQRLALATLLVTKLGLPSGVAGDNPAVGMSPRSRRGQTGARARWGGPRAS